VWIFSYLEFSFVPGSFVAFIAWDNLFSFFCLGKCAFDYIPEYLPQFLSLDPRSVLRLSFVTVLSLKSYLLFFRPNSFFLLLVPVEQFLLPLWDFDNRLHLVLVGLSPQRLELQLEGGVGTTGLTLPAVYGFRLWWLCFINGLRDWPILNYWWLFLHTSLCFYTWTIFQNSHRRL